MPRVFYILLGGFTLLGVITYLNRDTLREKYLPQIDGETTVAVFSPNPTPTATPKPTPTPTPTIVPSPSPGNPLTTTRPLVVPTPTIIPGPTAPGYAYYDNLPRSGPELNFGLAALFGGSGFLTGKYWLQKKRLKKSSRHIHII